MRKSIFVPAGLFLAMVCQSALAVGPTYVKENITASANWTRDNSPYVIQSDVIVSKGAVLSIEPGVEVQFTAPASGKPGSGPNLVVEGGLRAVGNSTSPISFGPASAGSLWGAIYFYNADSSNCLMQACLIKGARIVCNGSSPTITQCSVYGAKTGFEIYGNSQPQIVNNRITMSGVGISLRADTASPSITNNEIYNNTMGIYLEKFGAPTLSGNRIYNNVKYNIVNYSTQPLTAPNNDFRLADARQIMRTIYDGAYNASLGRVNFMPFAGMAAGQTSAMMASAQPAANAEKPSISEEDFWSYGRPFDAMKISNVDSQKNKESGTVKVLAVGATAVVTAVLLFL